MLLEPLGAYGRLAVALAAGGAFAVAAWRARLLTAAAALAAGGLGAAIIGLGGMAWTAPALVFFGSSAGLSRIEGAGAPTRAGRGAERKAEGKANRKANRKAEAGPRDARQVGANGGVAGALLLAAALTGNGFGEALCFWGFVGAFAAAAADTWATEVGGRFGGAPRSLRTGRRVDAGVSGAVSGVGTLAAMGGTLAVSVSAGPLASSLLPPGATVAGAVLVAAGAGFLGAFADSLAGAFLQARYRHAQSGRPAEAPRTAGGRSNQRVAGVPGLTGDGVNALCTAVGALAAMAGVAAL